MCWGNTVRSVIFNAVRLRLIPKKKNKVYTKRLRCHKEPDIMKPRMLCKGYPNLPTKPPHQAHLPDSSPTISFYYKGPHTINE